MMQPPTLERLRRIPLDRLQRHPASANAMDEAIYASLVANIKAQGDYPP